MQEDHTGIYRSWCFTINNYTDDDKERIQAMLPKVKYLIYGHEICPTTGTPHLQGYVTWKSTMSFSSVKKKMPRANIRVARGHVGHNYVYCSKDATNVFEHGTKPAQGKRNDIEHVRELVNSGAGMEEIIEQSTSYQSMKTGELMLKYKERTRNFKPIVKWYYGGTGTGKTRTAYEESEGKRVYTAMETSRWYDGYDAHEVLIIDDMRRDFSSYQSLLKLLDRNPWRVETKGGTRQMLAKVIIITSPMTPQAMWQDHLQEEDGIGQLLRRIDVIRNFDEEPYRE